MNGTALGSVLVFAVLIATVNGWFKKGLDWVSQDAGGVKSLNRSPCRARFEMGQPGSIGGLVAVQLA